MPRPPGVRGSTVISRTTANAASEACQDTCAWVSPLARRHASSTNQKAMLASYVVIVMRIPRSASIADVSARKLSSPLCHPPRRLAAGKPAAERLHCLQHSTGQRGATVAAQEESQGSSDHEQRAGTGVSRRRRYSAGLAAHREREERDDWQAEPGEDIPQPGYQRVLHEVLRSDSPARHHPPAEAKRHRSARRNGIRHRGRAEADRCRLVQPQPGEERPYHHPRGSQAARGGADDQHDSRPCHRGDGVPLLCRRTRSAGARGRTRPRRSGPTACRREICGVLALWLMLAAVSAGIGVRVGVRSTGWKFDRSV